MAKKWDVYVVCGEASAVLLVLGDNIAAAKAAALKRCEEDRHNIAWEGGVLGETVWVDQVVYQGRDQ